MFWPCVAVETEGKLTSIIFTDFALLDDSYPGVTSGYAVTRLVKKLLRGDAPALLSRVKFDPEADMFSAYDADEATLRDVARLLRQATGKSPPRIRDRPRALSPDQARSALRRGFIAKLDPAAQRRFREGWPRSAHSGHDAVLRNLAAPAVAKRLAAARRVLRTACRCVGDLADPFCHPDVIDAVMAACERERVPKVHEVLVDALAMMVERALPDLRTAPLFEALLAHPRVRTRIAAVTALGALATRRWETIRPLLADAQPQVRKAACLVIARAKQPLEPWILDDDEIQRSRFPGNPRAWLAPLLADRDRDVRNRATAVLARR